MVDKQRDEGNGDGVSQASRNKFAERLNRYSRHAVLGVIPLALIAVIDLLTGSLTADRRIDYALLAAAAMGLWSAFAQRRLARRFRSGTFPQRATPMLVVKAVASVLLALALGVGMGYLIGGWVLAVVLPAAATVLIAFAVFWGRRQRRGRTERQERP
jgi:peptidoglycan/LPS O-acetylase OafA/YrhL